MEPPTQSMWRTFKGLELPHRSVMRTETKQLMYKEGNLKVCWWFCFDAAQHYEQDTPYWILNSTELRWSMMDISKPTVVPGYLQV